MENYKKTSHKISEIITKSYSTSFYTASLLFPPKMREAIFSIYGFVRLADEIVDSFHQYNKEDLLNTFESDLKNALNNKISLNPVLHSFMLTINEYNIDYELIGTFLNSMRKDLSVSEYASANQINDYIYGSAEVVGLMCLKVFCNGNTAQYNSLVFSAKKLGSAFQKVNFIRDLNADMFELNRTYFPEIKKQTHTETLKNQIISDIEDDFKHAHQGIAGLPKDAKPAVYIAYLYYKKLLEKIKRSPAERILSRRIRVPNIIKFTLITRGLISCKLNLVK